MQPLQEGIIWNKNTLHRSRPLLQERVRTDWQISSERPAPPLPLRELPRNRFLLLILTHEPSLSAANLVLDMAQTSNVEKSKHRKDGKIRLVTPSEQDQFSHWTGKSENLLNFQFAETWTVEGVVMRWTRGTTMRNWISSASHENGNTENNNSINKVHRKDN